MQPPSGPEDAELVLWEEAREWAEMEFKRLRPSIEPLTAYTLGEIEIPALAQERMEELREQLRGNEPRMLHRHHRVGDDSQLW